MPVPLAPYYSRGEGDGVSRRDVMGPGRTPGPPSTCTRGTILLQFTGMLETGSTAEERVLSKNRDESLNQNLY